MAARAGRKQNARAAERFVGMMNRQNIDIPQKQLADFCQRWSISEFALFGSVLRDDFDLGSDVDILATFTPGTEWSLLDHLRMEQELATLLGRKIDLFSKRTVEKSHNWIRRREILNTAKVVHVSQ
jgi:predicted nucleotidyltransferase